MRKIIWKKTFLIYHINCISWKLSVHIDLLVPNPIHCWSETFTLLYACRYNWHFFNSACTLNNTIKQCLMVAIVWLLYPWKSCEKNPILWGRKKPICLNKETKSNVIYLSRKNMQNVLDLCFKIWIRKVLPSRRLWFFSQVNISCC